MEPSTVSFLFLTLESKRKKIYSIIFRNDLNHLCLLHRVLCLIYDRIKSTAQIINQIFCFKLEYKFMIV